MATIEFHDVTKRYGNDVLAVDKMSHRRVAGPQPQ